MRNVILLYDAIKGTHLEQLTPQDARQQFSAQDAAKLIARVFIDQVEDAYTSVIMRPCAHEVVAPTAMLR